MLVSIPQAVSAVATVKDGFNMAEVDAESFNTASGKRCCNFVECV